MPVSQYKVFFLASIGDIRVRINEEGYSYTLKKESSANEKGNAIFNVPRW